jgi:hypothetical protein
MVTAQGLPVRDKNGGSHSKLTPCQGVIMRKHFGAIVAVVAVALAGVAFVNPATARDARYAVVHIANETNAEMSFYRTWVWHPGTSRERVQISWKLSKIPPGETRTVHYNYDGPDRQSPELIVVFDSDRNRGAHWEKVKLARGAAADFNDKRSGFTYVLRYDNDRREFASLRPTNGGSVTVLDRNATPPRISNE